MRGLKRAVVYLLASAAFVIATGGVTPKAWGDTGELDVTYDGVTWCPEIDVFPPRGEAREYPYAAWWCYLLDWFGDGTYPGGVGHGDTGEWDMHSGLRGSGDTIEAAP